MKTYSIFSLILLIFVVCTAQINVKAVPADFEKLSGSWAGSLTYLDYSSGQPYTMPADLGIKRIEKTNKFIFSNIYPNEASANSIDTVTISTDGHTINKELVKSRQNRSNGNVVIVTEEAGKDGNDNKQATIRHTYTFGKTTFSKRKDIQFKGETTWINRHEYSYKKKPGN